jgi:hypothetical protein
MLSTYLHRHFIPWDVLVRRSGATEGAVRSLIDAGAAPGIVYHLASNGDCWSALANFVGVVQPERSATGEDFFAPSALYWIRRGALAMRDGVDAAAAASANRDAFVEQFVAALQAEPLAADNYPNVFPDHCFNLAEARKAGVAEWAGWTSGAYAVCLRSFTGTNCVTKETLARRLRTQFADNAPEIGSIEALDLIERLSVVLMPFAPFERERGTPGLAVDSVLAFLALGNDEPFSDPWTVTA